MLQAPLPRRGRRLLGIIAVLASVLVSGSLGWAQGPVRILEQHQISMDRTDAQYQVAFKHWEGGKLISEPVIATLAGRQADLLVNKFEFQVIALPYPSEKGPDILLWLKVYDRSDSLVINQKVKKSWNVVHQKKPTRIEWNGGALEVVARAME